MRKLFAVLALTALSSSLVLGYGSGTSASMHLKLANVLFDAAAPSNLTSLVLTRSEFPDLYKFKQMILDGANAEVGHRNPADPNTKYWYGNEGQWENFVRASQYPTKAFRDAYLSIGYYVHLMQDSTIPAHDRVIFHGYPSVYYVAPGGSLLDGARYTVVRSDGLEFVAGDYDFSTLPVVDIPLATFHASPGTWSNTPQFYNSTSPSCHNVNRKLWLSSGEASSPDKRDDYAGLAGTPESRTWGVYSFPTARGCDVPPVGADLDWYPRRLYPTTSVEAPQTAHTMGRTAVYLAIRFSSEAVRRFSRTLPPVVTSPASRIAGDFAGGRSTTFGLHLQENRTQGVFLTMRDAATGRTLRATISAPGLPARTIDLDGTVRIPLTSQADTNLTVLPWADQVSISWDGTLAGGTGRIGAGNQTITVLARDEDGNVSTGAVLVSSTATASEPGELVVNGGFESGTTPWAGTLKDIGTWRAQPARSGTRNAFLMGYGRVSSDALYQTVSIPATVGAATLTFYLHIDTAETTTTKRFDFCDVEVLSASGALLKTLGSWNNLDASTGYVLRTFDLTAYKGQTIRINFRATEDSSKQTSFVIDDVSVATR